MAMNSSICCSYILRAYRHPSALARNRKPIVLESSETLPGFFPALEWQDDSDCRFGFCFSNYLSSILLAQTPSLFQLVGLVSGEARAMYLPWKPMRANCRESLATCTAKRLSGK
jgi:hypothetical protein